MTHQTRSGLVQSNGKAYRAESRSCMVWSWSFGCQAELRRPDEREAQLKMGNVHEFGVGQK
jgi:hypothetical protein